MKKKYTRPTIVKVELTHEQAVLGTCSADATNTEDGIGIGILCRSTPKFCKADNVGNSTATS